ncbi:hypothetical protein FRC12_015569 [Ceratobasidium sp. 428]|nr:hypothetical protein FRC12_015569 [Ceratobasidium sp. 428]
MGANSLLLHIYLPLEVVLKVLLALALIILVVDYLRYHEPSHPFHNLWQQLRYTLRHPIRLAYRLYWNRDRLLISVPLGSRVNTFAYRELAPGIYHADERTGTLMFALPGVIWVRYLDADSGSWVAMHGLLNTIVSAANPPTPQEAVYSTHRSALPSEGSWSSNGFARTSLNLISPVSSPPPIDHTPIDILGQHTLLPNSVPEHINSYLSYPLQGVYEDLNTHHFGSAPTPPPSLQSTSPISAPHPYPAWRFESMDSTSYV